jgi:KaiC/GvpD/RAD55 family RecA-like ATPase
MDDRISTGILGLDEKIQGGLIKGSVNFLTGRTGTGKTSFCASFLRAGALVGEKGIYVTTEEREEDIKNDIKAMFDWNFEEFERNFLIKFLSIKPDIPMKLIEGEDVSKVIKLYMYELMARIESAIREFGAKRLVVDSLSLVELFIKDEYLRKIALMQMIDRLKNLGITSILTGTIPEGSETLSTSGIIEFLADSVIKLDFVPVVEEFKRTLTVRKMRRTDHSVLIHPFEITKLGVRIIEIRE